MAVRTLTRSPGLTLLVLWIIACGPEQSVQDQANAAKKHESAARAELLARNVPAAADRAAVWKQFRAAYPYHMQVLALSDPAADGSRALVVAEPPPDVSEADILVSLAQVLRGHAVERQRIGYDGWVHDVVVTVAGDEAQLGQALNALYLRLFLTTYKAYILPLPVRSAPPQRPDLNLNVSAAELREWLISGGDTYIGPETDAKIQLEGLASKPCGVYSTDQGGLVGWWVPAATEVDACKASIRQFALDTDLVLGAVGTSHGTLILGRERLVPVDLLPPLRSETVSLLAWAARNGPAGQLAQSYERNALFAGRVDATHDWAPILLSPELRETEYGSLLDITDQLLKGWSNAGTTHYVNFEYPRPFGWPFARSLPEHLGVHEVVYNWNTAGAAYSVDLGDMKVLALSRTGALPVSYIPDGTSAAHPPSNVMAAEDRAYAYFAGLSDPNLVRVVQYAALYQIFSTFGVRNRPVASGGEYAQKRIEEVTKRLTDGIAGASDERLQRLAHDIAPVLIESLPYDLDRPQAEKLAFRTLDWFRQTRGNPKDLVPRTVLSAVAGQQKLPAQYARDVSATVGGWIHTPTVVVSWNDAKQNAIVIGGHNIDAQVTGIAVSDRIRPGSVEVEAGGGIVVNPRDAARVKGAVRAAGRFERAPAEIRRQRIIDAFGATPIDSPRTRNAALRLPASRPEGARLALLDDAAGWARQIRIGWFRRNATAALEPRNSAQIVVARSGGKYTIQRGNLAAADAYTVGSAADAVLDMARNERLRGDSLAVELRGFVEKDASPFLRTIEVRAHETSRRAMSALVRDANVSEESLAALRSVPLDLSRATILETDVESVDAGFKGRFTMDIPTADRRSKAMLEVQLTYDRAAGRTGVKVAMSRIMAWVRAFVVSPRGTVDAFWLNHQVNQAIKRISAETGTSLIDVRQTFRHGQHDLHFVILRHEQPDQAA